MGVTRSSSKPTDSGAYEGLNSPSFSISMDLNKNSINDPTELKARGTWNQVKGEAKQKWGQLTDSELHYAYGKQEEWFGKL